MRGARLAILWVLTCVLVAGCGGVPSSSSPEVIRGVSSSSAAQVPSIAPQPGADPRTIVQGFLAANVSDIDDHHAGAKAFLTADARGKWNDSTTTILDSYTVGVSDQDDNVLVTGSQVGSLDSRGIFSPDLNGDGTSGDSAQFSFVVRKENGQWRIQQPPNGVLIQRSDFVSRYSQQPLYFYDLAQQRLVPDLRFSPLSNSSSLASWRLAQLVAGPRAELVNAVQPLPTQANTSRASVVLGPPVTVEIPGGSQLESGTLNRLAAQIAVNFDVESTNVRLQITDGGKVVRIPGVGDTFTRAQFPVAQTSSVTPALYYLNEHSAVVDANGTAIPGPLANGRVPLNALALADSSTSLAVAATTGPAQSQTLLMGTAAGGLADAGVLAGPLSAPVWAPNANEVWVGSGSSVIRVRAGHAPEVVTLGGRGPTSGSILSLQFAPEGTRLAMVISAADGTAQAWVAAVVRSGDSVRIDSLTAISPTQLTMRALTWSGDFTLFLVGSNAMSGAYGIWSVRSDGSGLTERSHAGLPKEPDSITAGIGVVAWVSADGAVFAQSRSNTWAGPGESTTRGTSPTYAQ